MNREEAKEAILSSGGQIFGVRFKKRTTGEERTMCCRLGVKSHLKGGEASYSFENKGLISCFDFSKKDYRCIPIEGILEVTINGQTFQVSD